MESSGQENGHAMRCQSETGNKQTNKNNDVGNGAPMCQLVKIFVQNFLNLIRWFLSIKVGVSCFYSEGVYPTTVLSSSYTLFAVNIFLPTK